MANLDDYPRLKKYQDQLRTEKYLPVSSVEYDRLRARFHKIVSVNDSESVAVVGETFALIELLIEARVPISILDDYLDRHDRELMKTPAGMEDTADGEA